jgi:anti-sigma factor RsiW
MNEGYASPDTHAYVDNSLTPTERSAFEAALRKDSKLRARVEAWQSQNEAIRLAFGGAPKLRSTTAFGRPSNENNPPAKAESVRGKSAPTRENGSLAATAGAAPRRGSIRAVTATIGAAAFLVPMLYFCGGPPDPREPLMQRAATALRAADPYADTRLDFASEDPRAVSAWLAPRFARLPPEQLATPGLTLLGVRIVPGLDAAAALVLFEDAKGTRAALLLEPTDALPDLPPIGRRAGDEVLVAGAENDFAYAAVGPERSGVAALIPAKPSR